VIIPIASETYIRRFPLVTIVIIALNFLVFFITYPVMTRQQKEYNRVQYKLWKLEYTIYIRNMDSFPEIAEEGVEPSIFADSIHAKIARGEIPLSDEEYKYWKNLNSQLEEIKSNLLVRNFGFIPDRFNFLTLITSLFLHGGWLHLLGNMWFLWLVGVNIEDRWGRLFFLGFYIVSGIVASLFHAMMNYSDIPLIGASGAIAGLMGAFTVRFFNHRIRLLVLLFPMVFTFTVYAGVMFPFWFLEQLMYAIYINQSGVAFWAHVAGFAFGAFAVVIMKATGFESRVLERKMDETLDIVGRDFREAFDLIERGEIDGAIEKLLKFLDEHPDHYDANMELANLYMKKGNPALAAKYYRHILNSIVKEGEHIPIIQFYNDYIRENKLERYLLPGEFYRIADAYKKNNDGHGEIAVLLQAYKFYREGNDAPIILLRLIKALRENNMIDKAKRVYEELVRRFPRYTEQGKMYLEGGDY